MPNLSLVTQILTTKLYIMGCQIIKSIPTRTKANFIRQPFIDDSNIMAAIN